MKSNSQFNWFEIQNNTMSYLIQGEEELSLISTSKWFELNSIDGPGIYWIEHPKHGLIYIGESSNVYNRYKTHSGKTYFSALRRNLGENLLNFELKTIKGKKRYFSEIEDALITTFLKNCSIKTMPINFGRYELEEYLIDKHQPVLNRKGRK